MNDAPLYVFRYRNLLTEKTLASHRDIIRKHGSCWWGWWQRPAEDLRLDLWRDLQERLRKDGPLEIGLFDSAAAHLGIARRFVCPNGICLEVGALNTSALEQGKDWLAGMGRVADGAFEDVASTLGWAHAESLSLRLLVLHHHVTSTEDILPTHEFARGFGMATDARQTLRQAASHGVQLILHGHRHRPFLATEQVYAPLEYTQRRWSLGRVGIVGGGSAGSTSVDNDSNFFNLIGLHPHELELTVYRAHSSQQSKASFETMRTWTASLTSNAGRLELGDWTTNPGP